MSSHSKPAPNLSGMQGRARAEALRPVEDDDEATRDKTASDTSPRAGRTGGHGAKAERPADSRSHKMEETRQGEPTRGGGKAPSPAAGAKD